MSASATHGGHNNKMTKFDDDVNNDANIDVDNDNIKQRQQGNEFYNLRKHR